MLTMTPASNPAALDHVPKIGLAVAGGGPLGAIYELGALQALNESIDGLELHDLDAYVGVSAGSFMAAGLANQITTTQMCRIFVGSEDAEFTFRPEAFLRPAVREYLKRATAIPGAVRDLLREAVLHPARFTSLEALSGLSRLVPTGIFDNQTIETTLSKMLSRAGRTNDFRKLSTKLRIVAVELDSGQAVRFGGEGQDHIPISRAVQASAALPGLYPPVEIDGHYYVDGALRRTLHASAALREGIDLLIGINPLMPYREKPGPKGAARQSVERGGLPLVLSQTFRAMIQSRMQIGMAKYAAEYPDAGILVLEPNRDDERMFFTNVFSYASRSALADHAYQTTRNELLNRSEDLDHFLAPYGLTVNRTTLAEPRTLVTSLASEPRYLAPLADNLARTLERLDRVLSRPGMAGR